MYRRLIKFIKKNKILTQHQYGFRENRSTELAIIELTNKLTKAIDNGDFTIGIFLDLSKAFDTINHRILIKKTRTLWHPRSDSTVVSRLFNQQKANCQVQSSKVKRDVNSNWSSTGVNSWTDSIFTIYK